MAPFSIKRTVGGVRLGRFGRVAPLVALVGASAVLRAWAAEAVRTPWINSDEITYSQLGRELYLQGHLWILGKPVGFLSLVYPALVGLPMTLRDVGFGYALLKVVQAVVMSLTAVPVYLWARRLVAPVWAWAAAALTVAIPGLAYSGLIMSEVVFVPVMTVAAWAIAAALERPSLRRQGVVFLVCAVAIATRLQAVILLPAYASAILAFAAIVRRPSVLRRFAFSYVAFAAIGAVLVYRAVGGGATSALGGYQGIASASVGFRSVVRFVTYHAADVILICGVIPACALCMLLAQPGSWRSDRRVAASLTAITALVVWQVVEVGAFAAEYVGHLAERNLLPVAPLMFIAFAIWLDRGGSRPTAWAWGVALGFFALLALVPFSNFVPHALPDTFSLTPLQRVQLHYPDADVGLLLVYGAVPLLALFVLLPVSYRWVMAAAVGVTLVYSSVAASQSVAAQSRFLAPRLLGSSKNWIDRASTGQVGFLYAGEPDFNPLFENIFWNRKIHAVYDVEGNAVPGPLPQTLVRVANDGLLHTASGDLLHERYVAAGASLLLAGQVAASAPVPRVNLWRTSGSPRLVAWLSGIDVDQATRRPSSITIRGHLLGPGHLTYYRCTRARVSGAVVAQERTTVTVSGGARRERLRLRPGIPHRFSIGASGAGRCSVDITANTDIWLRPLAFVRLHR